MEISLIRGRVNRVIYSDEAGVSLLFIPKISLNWWSDVRMLTLKTSLGDKVYLTPENLRSVNLKMTLVDVGTPKKPKLKAYMVINKPSREKDRIPLLAISNKLQKRIGRSKIDVEREYRERDQKGYRYWEPRTNCRAKSR